MSMTERGSPQALERERALLGGLLMDNDRWPEVDALISEEDFYSAAHAKIYAIIRENMNADTPVDMLVVHDVALATGTVEDFGGLSYITALPECCPSTENLARYAQIVLDKAMRRRSIEAMAELDKRLNAGEDVREALAQAQEALQEQAGRGGGSSWATMGDLVKKNRETLEYRYDHRGKVHGLSTGFSTLDAILGGMQKTDLIILAARPAAGKTMFALNIAERAVLKSRVPVGAFSLEMGAEQLSMRVLGSRSRVNAGKLRTGMLSKADDWPALDVAEEFLANAPLFIDDTPGLDIAQIRARAKALQAQQPDLGLIVVDYIQLAGAKGARSREQEISAISRGLKHMAKDLNIPVLALSQLNRGVEQRANKRPMVSDLRESGAIEQDSDVILMLYRDAMYNTETTEPNIAEIIIAKHRNGPTGTCKLYFDGARGGFQDLETRGTYGS